MKFFIIFMIVLIAVLVQDSTAIPSFHRQEIDRYRRHSPQYNYATQYLSQRGEYILHPRSPHQQMQYLPRPSYSQSLYPVPPYQLNPYQRSPYPPNSYQGSSYPQNPYQGSIYPPNPYPGSPGNDPLQPIGNRNPRYALFEVTNLGGVSGHVGDDNGPQKDIVISLPSGSQGMQTRSAFGGGMLYSNYGGVTGHHGKHNQEQSGICIGVGCKQ